MLARSKEFPDYNFEDKLVIGNNIARNTIMINKNLQYKRLPQFEDDYNSTTVIKFKDGKSKWVHLVSIYRQWKLKGEFNAFDKEGIKKQVERLKSQCKNLHKIREETDNIIIGGDINIDKNLQNDPTNRPELKALTPIWDKCMLECGFIQLNFKDTWHMPGKRSSLLDLFYTTKPQMISGVANVTNILSEHDGVTLNLHTKNLKVKPQFEVVRNYKNVNYTNLMDELDENRNTNIQQMFQSDDPEIITEIYINEMNKAVNKHIIIKKIQRNKFTSKFMNKKLAADRKKINFWNKKFKSSGTHEDYRVYKHLKNKFTKDMLRAKIIITKGGMPQI